MTNDVGILNDLLEIECASTITRLGEAKPFIAGAEAHQADRLERIVADNAEHARLLSETIQQLDGVPRPPRRDTRRTSVQYLGLPYLLPRIVAEEQAALEACRAAAGRVAHEDAAAVLTRITRRHEQRLAELQAMSAAVG